MKLAHILTAVATASLALTTTAYAAPAFDANQKAQIDTMIHDYLMQNPQVIMEAVNTLQKAEYEKMQQKTQMSAINNVSALFHQANDPVVGNPNGKVTVVEFFDYQCPHCVEMTPAIDGLMKANPDVRIVLKDFPIRGPLSVTAAKAALAAKNQNKYWEMHQAIMKAAQGLTEAKIYDIAQTLGLDVNKLKTDMNSAAIDAQIKATYKLATDLQLMGTPALFVAKTDLAKGAPATAIVFIPGQVDQKTLQATVEKAKTS